MTRITSFILFFLFSCSILAQRVQQRIEAGNDFFEKGQYEEAIDVYQKILRNEDDATIRQELSFKTGDAYKNLWNYKEAKKWYQIALNLGYNDYDIYLNLSEMTLGLEEFDNAIDYLNTYLEKFPEDDMAQKLLQSATFAKENYNTETIFETSNEKGINNSGQQWGVSFLENVAVTYEEQSKVDEQFDINVRLRSNNIFYWIWSTRELKERIVFSSTQNMDGTAAGYSNIYQATFNKREKDWDMPKPLSGGINSDYYDGFLSYDKVNEIAYFMNSGGTDGNRATADLYTVKYNKQDDTWSEPEIFPFNSDEFNIGYPSVSEDGSVLYFASDMPGGKGGYDIYKMKRIDQNTWEDPVNLGDSVNTPFNDSYPFIAGDVLYFSSYGHPGFGGFDIYYSEIDKEGNYSSPVNMGAPVNSSADDFGFVIDEDYTRGFFSSNRPGGEGEDGIYSLRIVPKTFQISGRTLDSLSKEPVPGVEIYFMDDKDNFYTATSDAEGFYSLSELSTDVNYFISAFPEDYRELNDTIAVKDQLLSNRFTVIKDYEKDFILIPNELPQEKEPAATPEPEPEPEPEELLVEETHAEDAVKQESEDIIVEALEEQYASPLLEETFEKETEEPVFNLITEGFPVIYFDFAKANLDNVAYEQLDSVISYLRNNPDKGIIVDAHTDEISGYLFNFYLSQERAQSILKYLRKQDIDPRRIYPQGHGKMNLAYPNAVTDNEHRLNRRAEFQAIPMEQLQAYLNNASRHSFRYLNNIEKDAYFAEGIEFMVQFMASNIPIHPSYYQRILENMPGTDIIYYYDNDRYHRYLVGSFNDFDSAFNMQRELRKLGYEIYIVAFDNGERIPVSKARKLTGQL